MANADEKSAGAQEPALARLAAHYGIEPDFRDARGKEIVTSPETQKRLLAAMGRYRARNSKLQPPLLLQQALHNPGSRRS